jgi:hypothetical protein
VPLERTPCHFGGERPWFLCPSMECMHHTTYMRLFWEHHEAEVEQLAGMKEWLDRLERKIG